MERHENYLFLGGPLHSYRVDLPVNAPVVDVDALNGEPIDPVSYARVEITDNLHNRSQVFYAPMSMSDDEILSTYAAWDFSQ